MATAGGSPELISGPDLGGGLLHQLTFEERPDGPSFTFHAQDGGADAGGPPIGSPLPFGFHHPAAYCGLGGPRCFERRFLVPRTSLLSVRAAYNRIRFVMSSMLEQEYRAAPVPLLGAVRELAHRVGPELARRRIPWFIGGSTAIRLLGGDVSPRDVDVAVASEGTTLVGELLTDYLIEPVARTIWGADHEVVGGRAYIGTLSSGTRVEWAAAPDIMSSTRARDEWSLPASNVPVVEVAVEGGTLPVARPEFALVKAARGGHEDRIKAAAGVVSKLGVDRALLDELIAASSEPPRVRAAIAIHLSAAAG
ncbi:MAG: hypothetical protein L3K09_05470 [Thermoplasmata archaeon]|nr:hypothetical protein [Thermoplasmata archaeon]